MECAASPRSVTIPLPNSPSGMPSSGRQYMPFRVTLSESQASITWRQVPSRVRRAEGKGSRQGLRKKGEAKSLHKYGCCGTDAEMLQETTEQTGWSAGGKMLKASLTTGSPMQCCTARCSAHAAHLQKAWREYVCQLLRLRQDIQGVVLVSVLHAPFCTACTARRGLGRGAVWLVRNAALLTVCVGAGRERDQLGQGRHKQMTPARLSHDRCLSA